MPSCPATMLDCRTMATTGLTIKPQARCSTASCTSSPTTGEWVPRASPYTLHFHTSQMHARLSSHVPQDTVHLRTPLFCRVPTSQGACILLLPCLLLVSRPSLAGSDLWRLTGGDSTACVMWRLGRSTSSSRTSRRCSPSIPEKNNYFSFLPYPNPLTLSRRV